MNERGYLSIGEVLLLLQEEFQDLTISKIRFLESQGLIEPERTASGYRKFYDQDVERLRFVLREQKDHYLPLRVIKDRLEGGEATGPLGRPADAPGPAPLRPPAWSVLPGAGDTESVAASTAVAEASPPEPSGPIERPTGEPAPIVRPAPAASAVPDPTSPSGMSRSGAPGGTDPRSNDVPGTVAAPARAPGAADAPPAAASPGRPPVTAAATPSVTTPAATTPSAATASAATAGATPRSTRSSQSDRAPAAAERDFTLDELVVATGLGRTALRELEEYGLITGRQRAGEISYDTAALEIATVAAGLLGHGFEPRHLRMYRQAADREVSLFEQVVMPFLKQRNPQARVRAAEDLADLTRLGAAMREALVREALRPHLD